MGDVKRTDGGDFMLGSVGLKKPAARIHNSGELDIDGVVQFMDSKKDGEKLRAGLDSAVSALEALKKTGLTGECLVVLVAAKCQKRKNGDPIPNAEIQKVLEALFRIGEFVR